MDIKPSHRGLNWVKWAAFVGGVPLAAGFMLGLGTYLAPDKVYKVEKTVVNLVCVKHAGGELDCDPLLEDDNE